MHSGHFPLAYVYSRATRATRDLLRRRLYFVCRRADLLTQLQIVEAQQNLEPLRARLDPAGALSLRIAVSNDAAPRASPLPTDPERSTI